MSIDSVFSQGIREKIEVPENWKFMYEANSTFCLHSMKPNCLCVVLHFILLDNLPLRLKEHDCVSSWYWSLMASPSFVCPLLHTFWMCSLLLILFPMVCEHTYFSFKVNNHPLNVDIISFLPFIIMFMETLVHTHYISFNVFHLFLKALRLKAPVKLAHRMSPVWS